MELHDPYRAPASLPAPPALPRSLPEVTSAAGTAAAYYSPSTVKMVLLCPTTMGLYTVYWFWRNWQAIKRETGGSQWPWARALFSPIWSFICFSDLRDVASSRRRELAFAPGLLGAAYFLLNLTSRLPNAAWLFALLSFLPLLPVNSLLRRYHQDERVDMRRMDRFNVWHILVIIFGGLFLLLAIIGTVAESGR
jgi:hypothetical protein